MSEETTTNEVTEAMDFNLDTDVIEEPLVPQGNYIGSVTEVKLDLENYKIQWKIVLNDNAGLMSDGETEVNGATLFFNNWLPKPGDDVEMTSNGRTTKRQSKINQLGKFAEKMKIKMNTMATIREAIDNGDWVGIDVVVSVKISEYQGNVRNEVSSMVAR